MYNLNASPREEGQTDQTKLIEIMKNRFSSTPLLSHRKKSKFEEPSVFALEPNENLVNLLTGCQILSNSHEMEKAEETYTDQVLNLTTNFRKHFSKMAGISDLDQSEPDMLLDKSESGVEVDFSRIEVKEKISTNPIILREHKEACFCLVEIMNLRKKYLFPEQADYQNEMELLGKNGISEMSTEPYFDYSKKFTVLPVLKNYSFENKEGIFLVTKNGVLLKTIPTMAEFIHDLAFVVENTHNSSIKSFCNSRLEILDEKFRMHLLYNREKEMFEQQSIHHRDFYNIRKVDTHIHHSACMRAKHLLRFMRTKFAEDGEREVLYNKETKTCIKLKEVIAKLNLTERDLNLDSLNVQADASIFERFDRFNNKYNPLGQSDLREIFLKTDNYIKGKYLADITKQVMKYLEKEKYCYAEWRISIYGKSINEWQKLAQWFTEFNVFSHQVRWMIQIPRLYSVYKKAGVIKCFQDMLDNLFKPLFEVTLNPESDPDLYRLLFQIVGFDTVDDESIYETLSLDNLALPPGEWSKEKNPHYAYWIYYFYANLYYLNLLRKTRGLNTFTFRPHCGESGNIDHLATAFLVADGINHGIKLNRAPVLQYLYYLKQIGIAMSPLSNNKLFLQYSKSPFPLFFSRGLNVSLSTDDPLIIHLTKEPLVEEYAVAAQVWNLSSVDLAEIARYSVFQCSFEETLKKHWIGKDYDGEVMNGNG